jgi:CDP-4-dehydro-6-deoxyglucose reductase
MSSFTVTIEPSARQFTCDENQTLLGAAIEAGVGLPYGCKDGACGSCKCRKISGTVTHEEHQAKALSAQEEEEGWVLTCCAKAKSDVTLHVKQVGQENMPVVRKMPVRVAHFERLASDVMLIQLQLPAHEKFEYLPGQYIDFLLKDGQRRSFSIANAKPMVLNKQDAAPAHYIELHVRHLPGGHFTDHVFENLKAKEIFRIEGPLGGFHLQASDKPILFLASGTGFAPIKALLEQIHAQQQTHTPTHGPARQMVLYWGARVQQDLYMIDWVQNMQKNMPELHFVPVLSDEPNPSTWQGRRGFVHLAALQDHPDMSQWQVYACGAPIVIESALKDFCQQAHLPAQEFFADAFTSLADKAST